jgi:hypothetical protein
MSARQSEASSIFIGDLLNGVAEFEARMADEVTDLS